MKKNNLKKEQPTLGLKELMKAKKKFYKIISKDMKQLGDRLRALNVDKEPDTDKALKELNSLMRLSKSVKRDISAAHKIEKQYKALIKAAKKSNHKINLENHQIVNS